jgi:DeoR family glycerol-3-phosphate regulon repressor
MFPQERKSQIIQILKQEGRVRVKDLSRQFGMSEDAIRKDLQALEKEGILERTYGGGILKTLPVEIQTIDARRSTLSQGQHQIAKKAMTLIEAKDVIFIDISSTTLALAEELVAYKHPLTVVTNDLEILYRLCRNPHLRMVCPGGVYNHDEGGFTGTETMENLTRIRVNKIFMSTCGIPADLGIMTYNIDDGNTKRVLLSIAHQKILLVETKKFHSSGLYQFANLKDFDYIISEKPLEAEIQARIADYSIHLL